MAHKPFSAALSDLKIAKKKPAQKRTAPESAAQTKSQNVSRAKAQPAASATRRRTADASKAERVNELAHHSYDDRLSFREAMRGVVPLDAAPPKPKKHRAPKVSRSRIEPEKRREADADAMAQLDALIQPEHRFRLEKDGPYIRGLREGAHASHLGALEEGFAPEASLDLHGLRGEDAERAILRFIRSSHQARKRQLLIIHGRGKGSAGGVGVLGELTIDTLTRTGLSKLVLAFASAPRHLGDAGAIVIRLGER